VLIKLEPMASSSRLGDAFLAGIKTERPIVKGEPRPNSFGLYDASREIIKTEAGSIKGEKVLIKAESGSILPEYMKHTGKSSKQNRELLNESLSSLRRNQGHSSLGPGNSDVTLAVLAEDESRPFKADIADLYEDLQHDHQFSSIKA
jgi:hypothetical protein